MNWQSTQSERGCSMKRKSKAESQESPCFFCAQNERLRKALCAEPGERSVVEIDKISVVTYNIIHVI